MKFTAALGGFFGFSCGVAGGLIGGRDPGSLLLQAMLACVVGALLFRWLHNVLIRGVIATQRERQEQELRRRREERAARQASNAANARSS